MSDQPKLVRLPNLGSGLGLLAMYILMIIVISQLSPYFLGRANLLNLPLSVAVLGMIAVFILAILALNFYEFGRGD